MPISRNDTAVVFLNPQNEVSSEKGAEWAAVGESVKTGVKDVPTTPRIP